LYNGAESADNNGKFVANYDNALLGVTLTANSNRNLFYELQNSGNIAFSINGNTEETNTNNINGLNGLSIGDIRNLVVNNYALLGNIQEIIIYPSNQSGNKIGIQTNINTNYAIYSAFDADAQAFFDRVTTAGGTLSATEKTAVNTLVIGMKADGIWTKMKAIYPMVGGGQANPAAACSRNLKSDTFNGTFSNGWTFSSAGVKGNGTSALMNTNFKNSDFQNYDSTSLFYYGNVGTRNSSWDSGNINAVPNLRITVPPSSTQVNFQFNSANITTINYTPRNGFFGMNRISDIQVNFFANNSKLITVNETLIANLNTNNIVIGEQFSAGSLNFSDRLFKFYSLGSGLTDTEAGNFYTLVQAFQTTLNRQV
jgi:hypothetical protein